jgi:activating signal cointegrator 1
MKCLSLWQPWAELVRRGLKLNETRGWPMPNALIDRPLAIHASRQKFKADDWDEDFCKQLLDDEVLAKPLLYGVVLCVVHPERSVPTIQVRDSLTRREFLYGNYEERDEDTGRSRYAWPFMDIRVLPRPIPLVGHQGIFDWPEGDEIYKELW